MSATQRLFMILQIWFLRISSLLIAASCLFALFALAMAALGQWPWLMIEAGFGAETLPQAGIYAQIGLTFLLLLLLFYLPTNGRIMALEHSHRQFHMGMEDITRAYRAAHAADRAGVFQIASEFDAVRERLDFLRSHPELATLEPEVIELAAQMSQISHELAETYSDAKVDRARLFLRQRQEELEAFQTRFEDAKIIMHELRQWTRDLEIEESIAKSHLARLRDELFELLPELSAQLQGPPDGSDPDQTSVVPMQPSPRRRE